MRRIYNVYCDESCHLEHDRQRAMAIGALWCPTELAAEQAWAFRQIVGKHVQKPMEIKWTKVSPAQVGMYTELVRYFFACPELRFRALIVPDKSALNHEAYNQDHNTWYYKMFFNLLNALTDLNRE